jgi:hypothetical protein
VLRSIAIAKVVPGKALVVVFAPRFARMVVLLDGDEASFVAGRSCGQIRIPLIRHFRHVRRGVNNRLFPPSVIPSPRSGETPRLSFYPVDGMSFAARNNR